MHCTKFSSGFGGVSLHSSIVLSLELSEKLRRMKLVHPEYRTHARIVNIELAVRAKFHDAYFQLILFQSQYELTSNQLKQIGSIKQMILIRIIW